MFSVSLSASLVSKFLALTDGGNQRQRQLFEDVLQNSCSLKFCEFHRKTRVLESPLNKFRDRQACNFIQKRLQHWCFPLKLANFLRKTFLMKHPSGCFCEEGSECNPQINLQMRWKPLVTRKAVTLEKILELYLGSCQTAFCKNTSWVKATKYILVKTIHQMFDSVLNISLIL